MAQSFNLLITLALFGGVCVGAVFLQIYLSKARSRLPGLILPLVTFGLSVLVILSVAVFAHVGGSSGIMENGVVIERSAVEVVGDPVSTVVSLTFVFLGCNIPTGILLAIYFAIRSNRKKESDIQKMSVQDIE